MGGVELRCNATTGLLNQTGWRRLGGFVEVRLHGGRALLDNHLIQHVLRAWTALGAAKVIRAAAEGSGACI